MKCELFKMTLNGFRFLEAQLILYGSALLRLERVRLLTCALTMPHSDCGGLWCWRGPGSLTCFSGSVSTWPLQESKWQALGFGQVDFTLQIKRIE